ncbi:hypothetical protein [Streptomyces sp. BBFR102]|uniref:hypothetical protein n=1 Tax=Streptomyces sp. BBFR102 TaxID=3448171 RepID=UPI003F5392CE
MSIKRDIRALAKKFCDAESYRIRHLDRFLGEDGRVAPGKISEHNRAYIDASHDARSDLGSLIAELERLAGPELTIGSAVLVPADATTASGGFVLFDGEVTAEVVGEEDEDGDVPVEAGGLRQYVDACQLKFAE